MTRKLKNVTITLDEETARWTRIEAARRDLSISRMITEILREKMLGTDEYEAARLRYLSQEAQKHRSKGRSYPSRDELHDRNRRRSSEIDPAESRKRLS